MAKKKQTASTPVARDLIAAIGLQNMQTLLGRLFPGVQQRQLNNNTLQMACPIHGETGPSCTFYFASGHVYCFGCTYYTRDFLRFLADSLGLSPKDAIEKIRESAEVKFFTDASAKELEAEGIWQQATGLLAEVHNTYLLRCIAPPSDNPDFGEATLRAAAPTLRWLFDARGHDRDQVPLLPYGLVPSPEVTDRMLDEVFARELARRNKRGLPYIGPEWQEKLREALAKLRAPLDTSWTFAVSYVTGYGLTTPGRIRLRRPTSDSKDITILPGFLPDNQSPVGFYGLYNPTLRSQQLPAAAAQMETLVVEGENDATTVMERLIAAGRTGVRVIAACGNANKTDALGDAGVKKIKLLGDDPLTGNSTPFIRTRLMSAREVAVEVFCGWDRLRALAPHAKDPDDVVRSIGLDAFYQVALETEGVYRTPTAWVMDQIATTRAERNVAHDDAQAMTNIAGDWGQCIQNPAAQAAFIERACEAFGIAPGPLRCAVVQRNDNEETFLMRLTARLQYEFRPLYRTTLGRYHHMTCYHRGKDKMVVFPMHDGESIGLAVVAANGDIWRWINDQVGLPSWMRAEGEEIRNATPIKTWLPEIYGYMKYAAQPLFDNLPERSEFEEFGVGIHLLEDPTHPGQTVIYVHQGPVVYKGVAELHHAAPVWTRLDGPIDGLYYFRPAAQGWTREIRSTRDLEQGNLVSPDDLRRLIADARQVFSTWHYEYDTDAEFLAYHLLALTNPRAFPAQSMVAFTGETGAGKSNFLNIFAGTDNPELRLLDHSVGFTSYTPAVVQQTCDKSPRTLCLDEFEDTRENTQKGRAVQDLQDNLKQASAAAGAATGRGVANLSDGGKPLRYELKINTMFAGIHEAHKPEDNNRRLYIPVRRNTVGNADLLTKIRALVPADRYAEMRRLLAIGTLRYHRAWTDAYAQVKREMPDAIDFKVEPRFNNNVLPALAVMAFLGADWKDLYRRMCINRKAVHEAASAETTSGVLLDRLLRKPSLRIPAQPNMVRVLDLLGSDEEIDLLNETHCGFTVMKGSHLALIDWITAQTKGGLLDGWAEYAGMAHRNLKHILDQHPDAIRTEDYGRRGVSAYLRGELGVVRPELFSVVDVSKLVAAMRANRATTLGGAPTKTREENGNNVC